MPSKMFQYLLIYNLCIFIVTNCEHRVFKRHLLYPRSTVLQVTSGLSVPLILPRRSINFSAGVQVNYDLPDNLTKLQIKTINARDGGAIFDRLAFYQIIINYLDSMHLNGVECLLRAICDLHEYPLSLTHDDNLLEEIVYYLFTPSIGEFGNDTFVLRLVDAETNHQNCQLKYENCQFSLVDLFTAKFFLDT